MPQVQLARASHPRAADDVHAGENVPWCYGGTRSACALLINAVASHHRGESPASTRACTTAIIMPPRLTQPQLTASCVCVRSFSRSGLPRLRGSRPSATSMRSCRRSPWLRLMLLEHHFLQHEKARWPSRTTTSTTGRSCCGCTFAPLRSRVTCVWSEFVGLLPLTVCDATSFRVCVAVRTVCGMCRGSRLVEDEVNVLSSPMREMGQVDMSTDFDRFSSTRPHPSPLSV
mgnify:CR=1 FL=1